MARKSCDCAICGEMVSLGKVASCLPYWFIDVFNERKYVCKHCFSRLEMVDDGL
jgi:hypothetical protein